MTAKEVRAVRYAIAEPEDSLVRVEIYPCDPRPLVKSGSRFPSPFSRKAMRQVLVVECLPAELLVEGAVEGGIAVGRGGSCE